MAGAERHELMLDDALGQRIFELQRRNRLIAAQFGDRLRAAGVPGRHVGQADMADLAGAHQIVQRAHHLLGRRQPVPGMQEVEVDIIGAQPLQRSFDRAQDVLAAVAAGVRIAGLRVDS